MTNNNDEQQEQVNHNDRSGSLLGDNEFGNDIQYIIDPSLPGLSKHFRMLGIDCFGDTHMTDPFILYTARTENRIIVTRSSKLIHRLKQEEDKQRSRRRKLQRTEQQLQQYKESTCEEEWGEDTLEYFQDQIELLQEEISEEYNYQYLWVESTGRKRQLREVVDKLRIVFIQDRMFSRCSKCNGINVNIENKETIKGEVHANVYEENDYFAKCSKCNWITWGIFAQNPMQEAFHRNAVAFCQEFTYHPDATTIISNDNSDNNIENQKLKQDDL